MRVRVRNIAARPNRNEGGYAMVVLLVSLSVMAVMMSVAMPVWKQTAQREKETELVFRGEQYARAIALFQRKHGPGTLPPTINVLVEERFIRKKYKDPITNDDFAPILQGVSAGQANNTGIVERLPVLPPGQGQGRGLTQPAQQQGRGAQPGGNATGTAFGGVTGVSSKSKDKSIRLYKGRNHYNEWQFVYTPPAQAPGTGGANAPGVGGQRGRGNQNPANPQGGTPFPPGLRGGPGDGRGRGFGAPPDGRSGFPPFGPTSPSGPPRGTGPLPPGR